MDVLYPEQMAKGPLTHVHMHDCPECGATWLHGHNTICYCAQGRGKICPSCQRQGRKEWQGEI